MQAVRTLRILMLAGIALTNVAVGSDRLVTGTGEFIGHGRQCDGRLNVNTKTIEWHTPYASCGRRSYAVIERDLQAPNPTIVFQLKGRACDFGVISLHRDPEYPDYWIAKGYRNLEAYKSNSTDFLGCSLEKQGK